jgi:hypothetical protein
VLNTLSTHSQVPQHIIVRFGEEMPKVFKQGSRCHCAPPRSLLYVCIANLYG